jgi:p-methyltransferase
MNVLIIGGYPPMEIPDLDEFGALLLPSMIPAMFSNKDRVFFSLPTLGSVVVGTYLQQHGVEVTIKDFYLDEINTRDADIVGISSTFMMGIDHVREVVKTVKQQNPAATVIMGGPLSWSISPSEILEAIPDLDIIVRREGEATFLELVQALRTGATLDGVQGIFFRREGEIVETPSRPFLPVTDLLSPDWSLMDLRLGTSRMRLLPVETSRGCVYNCVYCSEVHYWDKPVRFKPLTAVVEEIRRNVKQCGVSTFRFVDSCFSAPPQRCAEVCDAIYDGCIREGLDIKWSSYARVSNLTIDLLEKMKRAGCVALDIGAESGDPHMLQQMYRRDYSPQEIIEVARRGRAVGILIHYNFVVGFPGETEETIQNTIRVIEEAQPDSYACFLLFLAPNTTLHKEQEKFAITGGGLSWRHATMTSEEAGRAMLEIYRSTSANLFPGGEYIAGFLTSLGYSIDEIREFFAAANRMARGATDQETMTVVEKASQSMNPFL